ncbi:MAG: thiamine diphosphokinase [Candidatus Zixiibacteriota bacterium]
MDAILLLNGSYSTHDYRLIKRRIVTGKVRPVIIAVDGGIRALQKLNIRPDYWVSDLDSSPRLKKGFLTETELLFYPSDKDKTDAELALDLCLKMKIRAVDIFGWADSGGETDHMLGNLLLPFQSRMLKSISIRFISPKQVIFPSGAGKTIVTHEKGKRLSILPITASVTLSLRGVLYSARDLKVYRGQSISLRNEITADRAVIEHTKPVLIIISG